VNCELNQINEACGAFEASLEVQRHALSTSLDGYNGPLQLGMSTTLSNLVPESRSSHEVGGFAQGSACVAREYP
jgi:hypothetical protein